MIRSTRIQRRCAPLLCVVLLVPAAVMSTALAQSGSVGGSLGRVS